MPSTPPPTPNADLVRDRLRARARRISVIRRRVVAAALATFAIAFGTIAASGSLGSTAATDSTQTDLRPVRHRDHRERELERRLLELGHDVLEQRRLVLVERLDLERIHVQRLDLERTLQLLASSNQTSSNQARSAVTTSQS